MRWFCATLTAAGLLLFWAAAPVSGQASQEDHTSHMAMEAPASGDQGDPHAGHGMDHPGDTVVDPGSTHAMDSHAMDEDAMGGHAMHADAKAVHAGHDMHDAMDETDPAQEDHSGHDHQMMMEEASQNEAELAAQVKVEERLGEFIDFSAQFKDSQGRPVDLEPIFDKPVVLLPVYFMCTSVCNFLQAELANVLNQTTEIPGKDFNVISLSFSDDEDEGHARTSKRNYANLVSRDMELDNWYYLTGSRENILKLTDSLGYYFVKTKKNFYIHPNALVVLAKDGKIIRYLYGPNFLPFDVEMALSEARKGEPGISIKRGVLSFCFDYDPENKTYVFKMFRITGTAILLLLGCFLLFLIRPKKSAKNRRGIQPVQPPPNPPDKRGP